MDKIKEIIIDGNYSDIDKLILIWKEIDKSKEGLYELAEAVDVPYIVLTDYVPFSNGAYKPKKKNKIQEYIDLFSTEYDKVYNKKDTKENKYKFLKKEIGQIANISKRIDLKVWDKVLKLVFYVCKKKEKGEKLAFTWNLICEDVRPSIIYSKLNYILKEIGALEKRKTEKFNGFRDDTKNEEKKK